MRRQPDVLNRNRLLLPLAICAVGAVALLLTFRPNLVSAEPLDRSSRATQTLYNNTADLNDVFNRGWDSKSVAWGDVDGDGDLDAAYANTIPNGHSNGGVMVFTNENGTLNYTQIYRSTDNLDASALAWGDVDGDGDLDLAVVSNGGTNRIYINTNGVLATTGTTIGSDADNSTSVAWADVNGDGRLDLAVGNNGQANKIYFNSGVALNGTAGWSSGDTQATQSIAFGDFNGNGEPDLAVGNDGQANQLFFNASSNLNTSAGWTSTASNASYDIATGDINQDGRLDLAVANLNQANHVYLNTGTTLDVAPTWTSNDSDNNTSVAVGDVNADRYPDLVFGAAQLDQPHRLYLNNAGTVNTVDDWSDNSSFGKWAHDVALVDLNGDGLLEISTAATSEETSATQLYGNEIYFNLLDIPFTESSDFIVLPTSDTFNNEWGDVNGDGFVDLIANTTTGVYLFSSISGTLTSTATTLTGMPTGYTAFGDMNADGIADLALGTHDTEKVYLGNGNGFSTIPDWESVESEGTNKVAWGDFDGDGDLDLVAANSSAPHKLYLNNGTTLATSPAWQTDDDWTGLSVEVGDIDADGDLDLVFASVKLFSGIQIYLNDGGTFPTTPSWIATDVNRIYDVALDDLNGDGLPELIAVSSDNIPIRVYYNHGTGFPSTADWVSANTVTAYSVATGDLDGDGDKDILTGGQATAIVYRNNGGVISDLPVWQSADASAGAGGTIRSVAIADADADGDLDFVAGGFRSNGYSDRLYVNGLRNAETDFAAIVERPSTSLADFYSSPVIHDDPIIPISFKAFDPAGVAIGRISAEFSLDGGGTWQTATPAAGSNLQQLKSGAGHEVSANNTHTFNWDVAADGVFGLNENTLIRLTAFPQTIAGTAEDSSYTHSIIGPFQRGAVSSESFPFRVRGSQVRVMSRDPVGRWTFEEGSGALAADSSNNANDGSLVGGATFSSDTPSQANNSNFSLTFDGVDDYITVPDSTSLDVTELSVGGWVKRSGDQPNWQPIITKENSTGGNRSFGLYLTEGIPDEVYASINNGCGTQGPVLRSNARLPLDTWSHVMMTYDGAEMKLYIDGQLDGSTPFNAPLCQTTETVTIGGGPVAVFSKFLGQLDDIRVYDVALGGGEIAALADGTAVDDRSAIVYRLPSGQAANASALGSGGTPFRTDDNGYLQGRGEIGIGDSLYALMPIASTDKFDLYLSNGVPNAISITGHTVTQFGVQTVTVSADNPLILFNLDLSIEWDARNDSGFLEDLDRAIDNASALLFDASNGQMAIGEITVHQAKENWLTSDILIFASKGIRPMAGMGGIVDTSTNDIGVTGVITDAFAPGQVRIGPSWDPFGTNADDLARDWQRALTHELAHYLLYLPDNYIGIVNNTIAYVDCFGSLMTNTYDEDYSEFLLQPDWTGPCLDTVAEKETGRTDWETITTFYPALRGTSHSTGLNSGPAILPLDLASLTFNDPVSSATTLPVSTWDLRAAESPRPLLQLPRAEGYLHKTNGTLSNYLDDTILQLGPSGGGGDRLVVRGADVGDRVCMNDAESGRFGCTNIDNNSISILMAELSDWQPDIQASPVSSVTMNITVTLASAETGLNLQIIPGYGSQTTPNVIKPEFATMVTADGGSTFTSQITFEYPAFEGIIRIWNPSSSPLREAISPYVLNSAFWGGNSRGWGGNSRGWGGNSRGWGGNSRGWGAPVNSNDGQATIADPADIMGSDTGISSLQALSNAPDLPLWLTLVGNAYRVEQESSFPYVAATDQRTISFSYLQSQVPDGYEYSLNIYFSADSGQTWRRLDTLLDQDENAATARVVDPVSGIYALLATVDIPPFVVGWNNFTYPIPQPRTVTNALASIDASYQTIQQYDPASGTWLVYDRIWNPLLNDFDELHFGETYWISMTEVVTVHFGVPTDESRATRTIQLPPETFYGFLPNDVPVGATIEAFIGDTKCGHSAALADGSQRIYKVNVVAENLVGGTNNCGQPGAAIMFYVDDTFAGSAEWTHSGLQPFDLDPDRTPTAVKLGQHNTLSGQAWLWQLLLMTSMLTALCFGRISRQKQFHK